MQKLLEWLTIGQQMWPGWFNVSPKAISDDGQPFHPGTLFMPPDATLFNSMALKGLGAWCLGRAHPTRTLAEDVRQHHFIKHISLLVAQLGIDPNLCIHLTSAVSLENQDVFKDNVSDVFYFLDNPEG